MTLQPQRLMTVPCTVRSRVPSGTDPYGGALLTDVETQSRCWYAEVATEERGGQVFQTVTAYFAPDAPLDHVTAVDIDGAGSWEVDGTPMAHRSPRTQVWTHQTVKLRRGA